MGAHRSEGVTVSVTAEQVSSVIAFHGHVCPGVAIGIRVAEAALQHVGRARQDEEVVAVCETDNCAVDAIQYLVGCTLGKGNLIVQPHGRNRFTFARRADGHAVRITVHAAKRRSSAQDEALIARVRGGRAVDDDRERFDALWRRRADDILAAALHDIVDVVVLQDYVLPPRATIEPSLTCSRCGLATMASRTREVDGEIICDACWHEAGALPVSLTQVGVVRSSHPQGQSHAEARAAVDAIELLPRLAPSLTGLAPGQLLQVFWLIDRAPRSFEQLQHPRGDESRPRRGVFALRTPHRPSPLALTTVELLQIDGTTLTVRGLDAWDGSPVIDIKPHAPLWDEQPLVVRPERAGYTAAGLAGNAQHER